jgi:pimeloyl-ACP methyl ester carboxylesterase
VGAGDQDREYFAGLKGITQRLLQGGPMIDKDRRVILTTGVAAAATATAAPQVFAQAQAGAVQALPAGAKVGFYEKGNVRIRYAEIGSGFPLLATPGGGLNSRIAVWPNAVINIMEKFKNDFRVITMDQRNASNGESSGPVPVDDPWGAFADDQLGVMDHLGIRQFFFFGNCIGGPFGLKLMERAPQRIVAALLSQPVGHHPPKPDYMYDAGRDVWGKELRERLPDVSAETIEKYLHNLYRARPDFVYSVSREFAKSCLTPMLVLPDDVVAHPLQVSIDIASLAPNAEITVFPWKDPPELKARTINRARDFLKRHLPV